MPPKPDDFPDLPDFLRIDPVEHARQLKETEGVVRRWTRDMRFGDEPERRPMAWGDVPEAETEENADMTKRKQAAIAQAEKTLSRAQRRAAAKAPTPTERRARAASAATATRRKAARAAPLQPGKPIRPGSKLEKIWELVSRPQGCTAEEAMQACDWPSISMPQQARAMGIKLEKSKVEGVTHYFVKPN